MKMYFKVFCYSMLATAVAFLFDLFIGISDMAYFQIGYFCMLASVIYECLKSFKEVR
ncbi:hypothetical protein [Macrococcus capreoli]|uniref:hypothetical protein n=1 Tax=Macrococcus capreoli TaxID=2982690 RepID=UPI003EE4D64E